MQQFIRKVTITGIDSFTNRSRLDTLQSRFPFVEWGVLLSENKEGKNNRYPPRTWVQETLAGRLNLSGHICGAWAREMTEGSDRFLQERPDWIEMFQRMQLNVSHVLEDIMDPKPFYKAIESIKGPRVILQIRDGLWDRVVYPVLDKVDLLFDCSGGRGVLPTSWPRPVTSWGQSRTLLSNCGYAGGLTPDNLKEQIEAIKAIHEGQPVWIDVESGVRTSEVLDLDKVERFLTTAEHYIIHGYDSTTNKTTAQADSAGGTDQAVQA